MTTATAYTTGASHSATTKSGILSGILNWLATQRSIRQTIKELGQLSDYELSDLGIARCDIPNIARQAAEKH